MIRPMIRIQGLEVRYGDKVAVAGLDMRVAAGEVLGLLGPNGAGKTSTVRCLVGLQAPRAGSITVAGFDVVSHGIECRRRLAYVPEHGRLYEGLTPTETLLLKGRLHGLEDATIHARAAHLFGELGIGDESDDPIASFSKGMRQKVVLACALLTEPEVLVLDEPLSGLDAETTLVFKEILDLLRADGKAILYCSHLLDIVEKIADRVLILSEGRSVAEGRLDDLLAGEAGRDAGLERVFRSHTGAEVPGARARRLLSWPA